MSYLTWNSSLALAKNAFTKREKKTTLINHIHIYNFLTYYSHFHIKQQQQQHTFLLSKKNCSVLTYTCSVLGEFWNFFSYDLYSACSLSLRSIIKKNARVWVEKKKRTKMVRGNNYWVCNKKQNNGLIISYMNLFTILNKRIISFSFYLYLRSTIFPIHLLMKKIKRPCNYSKNKYSKSVILFKFLNKNSYICCCFFKNRSIYSF